MGSLKRSWIREGIALAVMLVTGGCEVDGRRFASVGLPPTEVGGADSADPLDASTLGTGAGGEGNAAAGRAPEGMSAATLQPGAILGGSGICSDAGDCRCDEAAESCAPLPLCGDGGATCDSACPGCVIAGECVGPGAFNVGNPCELCDPARDALAWSNNDTGGCDDGLFCTTDDVCSEGRCVGTPLNCEDGVDCNGTATCNEETDSCSPGENLCTGVEVCSVAARACVSTCPGCVISGVCVEAGAEEPGNRCRVCDPARSANAYSPAVGRSCGAGPSACSQQDTCDVQGACRPNDLPPGAPCGDSTSSTCNQADACDGRGACQPRPAENGASCDDGQFCSIGESCQGGACVATGSRNCGSNQACNEAANQCQCQGCIVGGACFASGATNANNPCQICDPRRSTSAFSANVGANCGAGPTTCSAQDTCDAQGNCAPNHLTGACDDGQFCTTGDRCQGGTCSATGERDCGANQACTNNACQCNGCTVNGACLPAGSVAQNNSCLICDPARNTRDFSPNTGATCGQGPVTCSDQDRCNAQGVCAQNHTTGSCNDGRLCTVNDRCQGGACIGTDTGGGRGPCGANQTCEIDTNECDCVGETLTCPPPGGSGRNCGSWNFESTEGSEGWEFDVVTPGNSSAHAGNLATSTAVPAPRGNRSLAIRFEGTGNPNKTMVFVKVRLCSSGNDVDLSDKRLQALVRLVTDADTNPLTTGQGHVVSLYTNAQFPFAGGDFSVNAPGGGGTGTLGWRFVDVDLGDQFPNSASQAVQIGFRFLVDSVWRGTIYLDDVQIVPND